MTAPLRRLQAFYLEAPIDEPVVNAFGAITARPALLVRLEDADGGFGWGEVWCNFPPGGGRHRLNLIDRLLGRWFLGRDPSEPAALWGEARAAFRRVAIQCAEPGPVAQVLAGIDQAVWDLGARRRGLPLARHLGGDRLRPLPAYASGINPTAPERVVRRMRDAGYRAFKLKLGFAEDRRNLDLLDAEVAAGETLLVDLNQAWNVDRARQLLPALGRRRLGWIEEPIPADEPAAAFRELQDLSPVPLAGGENLMGEAAFAAAIELRALGVVQPDLAKWGGHSGAGPVARAALQAGLRYCPHYLGGGVGLLHSAHLLCAVGGDGLLEIDANPNPLRDELVGLGALDGDGCLHLANRPGIGAEPSLGPWCHAEVDLH